MHRPSLEVLLVGPDGHGRSTLIGRLFHDTGSLPEEHVETIRETGGMERPDIEFEHVIEHMKTIPPEDDALGTGRAFLAAERRDYAILSASEHPELLRDMIAGACRPETAVLLCCAYEGVDEPTRRHASLLRLPGLQTVLVVYNKMDLVGYDQHRFDRVRADVEALLDGLDIAPSYHIPVSALHGDNVAEDSDNLPWHEGPTVVEALEENEPPAAPEQRPVRFSVQDAYEVEGRQLAVGRVESGVLRRGAELVFPPDQRKHVVEEIVRFGESDTESAGCGECIGVRFDGGVPARGQIGCTADSPAACVASLEASLVWEAEDPLDAEETLTLRCSTQERRCRIDEVRHRIDLATLRPIENDSSGLTTDEAAQVTLQLETPAVPEVFREVPELGRLLLLREGEVAARGIVTKAG